MPIVGVIGIVGALASTAFSTVSWPWALSAVARSGPLDCRLPKRVGAGRIKGMIVTGGENVYSGEV